MRATAMTTAWAVLLLAGCGDAPGSAGDREGSSVGRGREAPAGERGASTPEGLQADVRNFLDDYMEAIGARDSVRVRAALVDDGRFAWIEDGEVRYRSADELLAGLAQLLPGSAIETELMDVTVVPFGDDGAHAWATHRTTFGEGADAFSFGGAISFVLERSGDSWVVLGGHTSSPRAQGG